MRWGSDWSWVFLLRVLVLHHAVVPVSPWRLFTGPLCTGLGRTSLLRLPTRNGLSRLQPIFASTRFDEDSIVQHTFTPQKILKGEIVEVRQLTQSNSPSETYHVVINHYGKLDYVEGQNVGIIPPG
jgi:hypothetical protein